MKTMIWIDASFAIEWLGGMKRAADVNPKPGRRVAILPLQYAEVCAFFLRGNRKASMADAVLAATVRNRGGVLYAFDEDFRYLGLQQESTGRWTRA
jgi:predicted nucleic acid-binding protein